MYTSLLFVKKLGYAWMYYPNGLSTGFALSKGYISGDEEAGTVQIVEYGKTKRPQVYLRDIIVQDDYTGGVQMTFTSLVDLQQQLTIMDCPLMVDTIGGGSNPSNNVFISKPGFTVSGNQITIKANWIWKIAGITYTNPTPVTKTITFCSQNNIRLEFIVPNNKNGFDVISGLESTSNPIAPQIPDNGLYVTFYQVTDNSIQNPQEPLDGTEFVKKLESQDINAVYNGQQVIEQIDLIDDRSSISITGTISDVKSLQVPISYIRPGKPFYIKNRTSGNVTLWNNSGTGNVRMFFIGDVNTVIKPNEILEFCLNSNDSSNYRLEVVGISSIVSDATSNIKGVIKLSGDLSGTADAPTVPALENKADLVNGLVPPSQLPSYVDDVLEFADLASFPIIGEAGKIYIALDTNLTYRWSGSVYVKISSSDAIWGNIQGSISNQTDLQNILNAKLTATLATDVEAQITAAVAEDNKVISRLKLFNWWVWQKTRAQVFSSSVQAQSFNTGAYVNISQYYATFTANASKRIEIDAANSRILGQNGVGTNSIYFSSTPASVNQYIPNANGTFLLKETLNGVTITQFQKSSFEPLYIRVNNFTSDVLEDLRINVASGNNRPFFERCITANASKGAGTWERTVSTFKINNTGVIQAGIAANTAIDFSLSGTSFNWEVDSMSSKSGSVLSEIISNNKLKDVDDKTTNIFRITMEFSYTAGAGDGTIKLQLINPSGIIISTKSVVINSDLDTVSAEPAEFDLIAAKTADNNVGYTVRMIIGRKALTGWRIKNILRTNN